MQDGRPSGRTARTRNHFKTYFRWERITYRRMMKTDPSRRAREKRVVRHEIESEVA